MSSILENSIWLEHPDYPGYRVSPEGRVLSMKQHKKIILKHWVDPYGYVTVSMRAKDSKSKKLMVHRLLAEVFIPGQFSKNYRECQVNHKNGLKHDNRIENLEWVTACENQRHRRDVLKKRSALGEKSGTAKLSEKQVLEIRSRLSIYKRGDLSRIAKEYGISSSNITAIKDGRSWGHIPLCGELQKIPTPPYQRKKKPLKGHAAGSRNGNSKLNEKQVRRILVLSKQGVKKPDLSKKFNISESTIKLIRSGKIWSHIK